MVVRNSTWGLHGFHTQFCNGGHQTHFAAGLSHPFANTFTRNGLHFFSQERSDVMIHSNNLMSSVSARHICWPVAWVVVPWTQVSNEQKKQTVLVFTAMMHSDILPLLSVGLRVDPFPCTQVSTHACNQTLAEWQTTWWYHTYVEAHFMANITQIRCACNGLKCGTNPFPHTSHLWKSPSERIPGTHICQSVISIFPKKRMCRFVNVQYQSKFQPINCSPKQVSLSCGVLLLSRFCALKIAIAAKRRHVWKKKNGLHASYTISTRCTHMPMFRKAVQIHVNPARQNIILFTIS